MLHWKKATLPGCMLFLLFAFCFGGCADDSKVPSETLRIGIMPDVESIPLILAEKNGYFAECGVEVELEIFKSARDRDSALQSHLLDGVVSDIVAVAFAHDGGIPLKITAQTDGNILLLANPAQGIETPRDLKGKEVALSTNTVMEYSLDQMLLNAGISPDEIIKTAIPQLPTRLEMLQSGQLAAAILPQPLAGVGLLHGAIRLDDTQALGEKAGVIAFTPEVLEERLPQVQIFFAAYDQAVEELNRAPAGTYDDFLIETFAFPESLRGRLPLPEYKPAALPEPEVFHHVMEWMQTRGLLQTPLRWEDASFDSRK